MAVGNRWVYDKVPYLPTINESWMPYATWESVNINEFYRVIIITLVVPERGKNEH